MFSEKKQQLEKQISGSSKNKFVQIISNLKVKVNRKDLERIQSSRSQIVLGSFAVDVKTTYPSFNYRLTIFWSLDHFSD